MADDRCLLCDGVVENRGYNTLYDGFCPDCLYQRYLAMKAVCEAAVSRPGYRTNTFGPPYKCVFCLGGGEEAGAIEHTPECVIATYSARMANRRVRRTFGP